MENNSESKKRIKLSQIPIVKKQGNQFILFEEKDGFKRQRIQAHIQLIPIIEKHITLLKDDTKENVNEYPLRFDISTQRFKVGKERIDSVDNTQMETCYWCNFCERKVADLWIHAEEHLLNDEFKLRETQKVWMKKQKEREQLMKTDFDIIWQLTHDFNDIKNNLETKIPKLLGNFQIQIEDIADYLKGKKGKMENIWIEYELSVNDITFPQLVKEMQKSFKDFNIVLEVIEPKRIKKQIYRVLIYPFASFDKSAYFDALDRWNKIIWKK